MNPTGFGFLNEYGQRRVETLVSASSANEVKFTRGERDVVQLQVDNTTGEFQSNRFQMGSIVRAWLDGQPAKVDEGFVDTEIARRMNGLQFETQHSRDVFAFNVRGDLTKGMTYSLKMNRPIKRFTIGLGYDTFVIEVKVHEHRAVVTLTPPKSDPINISNFLDMPQACACHDKGPHSTCDKAFSRDFVKVDFCLAKESATNKVHLLVAMPDGKGKFSIHSYSPG